MTSHRKDNSGFNDSSELPPLHQGRGEGGEVDINCDMGEGMAGRDELLMPYIHSANIACGYHAGDSATMWKTVELAVKYNVAIGAHPSFLDRDNFGRTEMNSSPEEIYELISQQLILLHDITTALDTRLQHVKPHGALYNMSARDPAIANTITKAIKDFDPSLTLFGLSGSHSIHEAKALGLKTASEVFADRTYRDDGSLTPRSQPHAVIENVDKAVQQVNQMIKEGTVTTLSGKKIPVVAETICIHGDGKQAVKFAQAIHDALQKRK